MALTDKLSAIADAIRGKTGGTEELTLDQMVDAIAGIESGGGGVKVTEYVVTENADRSLWLNEQKIKLVKGVNLLLSSKFEHQAKHPASVQGAVTCIVILWDGVAFTTTAAIHTANAESHIRGFQIPQSNYSVFGSVSALVAGYTSSVSVAEDGTLTCTTSATGVTTGNYNNSFIEGGYTYRLLQAESEVVC